MTREETQAATRGFPLRLSEEEYVALKTFAAVTETSANDVVRRALRDFFDGPGRREEFRAALERVREQYSVALDKLAEL